jgi:phosphate butyryltransferase
MNSFRDVIAAAQARGPKVLAVAGQPDPELQAAIAMAEEKGIAKAVFFDRPAEAVAAVRGGTADILMKGDVDTKEFMGAILDRDCGLRAGQLISHIAVFEALGRMMLVTDGGINLNPTLAEKVEIIKNALPLAGRLGLARPRVAVLAAVEKVNPKMPETVDAEALSRMNLPGCVVQGPLAVDNAVSVAAAQTKGISGEVAGRADILLVPSVLVGNIFAKGIMYFANATFGGVVAGTSHPVAFLSRSDTAETKLNTIALGVLSA